MSRSYKYPVFKDNDGAGRKKIWKKMFNRNIRRNKHDIPSGSAYKKCNEPWDICDFRFTVTEDTPPDLADKARRK